MEKSTKFFTCEKAEVNPLDRSVTAYISMETLDRDKEIVLAKGGDFSNFRRNPVVLWAHDSHGTPIGRCEWIRHDGRGILAKTVYADTPKADEIFRLRRDGFLKGYSIGFIPKQGKASDGLPAYGPPQEKELKSNPDWHEARNIVRAWELVEYSDVPIPCNPDALSRAYQGKSLSLSNETAKELQLPELAPEPAPALLPMIVAEKLGKKALKKMVRKEFERIYREAVATVVRELVPVLRDELHVRRGGV